MNNKKYTALLAAALLFTACHAKISGDNAPLNFTQSSAPSDYSEQKLSGSMFGQSWTVASAVARTTSANELSIEFYSEVSADACTSHFFPTTPYATMIIPANYSITEYKADFLNGETGNPLVFSYFGTSSQNMIADKSKLKITEIDSSGFQAYLFGTALDKNNQTSEINGTVHVTDCNKQVNFSVWSELSGNYQLQSFDGVAQNLQNFRIAFDMDYNFRSVTSKQAIKTLLLPLIKQISTSTDVTSYFGPMEGLGTTTVTTVDGVKTYNYSYNGPINYKGTDLTLILNIKIAKDNYNLTLTYDLEIPSYVSKTSHSLVLKK
ncbi:MAG: hypothetical protein WA160_05990 [Pseudobdellovibrio sp.]